MDPSKCYAVKVGTLEISGGTVKVTATGTAGRGLGADSMTLSGGTYDITVAGGPTDVYVESLVESDDLDDATYTNGVMTCLDSGGAACLKTSGTDSVLTISGGTFNLKATGNAGKLINAAGYLVIGTKGQNTLPTDASFSPDISGSTTGSKVYCTAVKQKYYGALAVATATTDIGALTLSVASDSLVRSSSSSQPGGFGGGPGGGPGGPGGGGAPGGGDDSSDYSNPKGIKGYSGVTIHGGRLVLTTKSDGGEGLESKNDLTINGGVIDLQCYDDAINSGGDLYINGGYVYAGSSGNDAIDSNGNIYMTDGMVLAFSTAGAPEVGIDTDSSSGLKISGGHLVAVGGAAGNMVVGSSGSQKTYMNTSASASTYSGKYLSMTGTDTFTVKMPTLSGSISIVSTTEGWDRAGTPTVSSAEPIYGSLGFHNTYLASYDDDVDAQENGLVVTFDAQGGSLGTASPTKAVEKGKAVGDLPKATRKGYTFNGWYTKTSGGTKIKTTTKVTKNVTYYAQWTANKYTIKFDKNGGTGSMKSLSATYGKSVTLTANAFKRTNYTFLGWATKKDATEAKYANKAKVKNLSSKSGGTATLYAVWQQNTYTVKFSANGGVGGTVKQTVGCGTKTALMTNGFTRAGFKFAGWATTKGGKVVYKNKAKVKDLAKSGKSVTLYAVWYPEKWAVGTFTGEGAIGNTNEAKRKAATVTLTVGSTGKISGKFTVAKKSYSFMADAFTAFTDGALCVETTLKYGTKTCVLLIAVSQNAEDGATVADLLVTYKDKDYGEVSLK